MNNMGMKESVSAKFSLEELQHIELGILDYIDTICKQYNIRYFLAYGTLIGAIRHKGFIPWDDDIDICMLRNDYNKFIEITKNEKGRYRLFHFSNTPGAYNEYVKVVDSRTEWKYPAPIGWDEYLKSQYGDYKQLPPESKRVSHPIVAYWKE